MAYTNALPIGVMLGIIAFSIMLVLALRFYKKRHNKSKKQKASEKDVEAARIEASAFDDGESDGILTPLATPRDALFRFEVHEPEAESVKHLYDGPNKTDRRQAPCPETRLMV
jgi:hypothetical protein